MIICCCRNVSDKEIKKCKSMEEAQDKLEVGMQCGSCVSEVEAILKEANDADNSNSN